MFSVDDLNAFATLKSLYPGVVHTPGIDRLMDMGTTFASAYAQAPLCNPSRTSALTGQLPTTTQVFDNNFSAWNEGVDPGDTIFKIIKDAGYHTVGAGKLLHSLPPAISDVLFDSYFHPKYKVPFDSDMPMFGVAPYTGDPDELGDVQASKAVSDFLSNYDASQPFFVSLGLNKPHAPWVVPQEYFDLYPLDQIQLPYHLDSDAADIPDFAQQWMSPGLQNAVVDQGLWTRALQGYFAAISYMDAQIGRVLDALEASGHADDTVIALWSDHGYHLGDKDVWHKFTLWDEAGRAPLIIADPGAGSGGNVVSTTVSLVDLMPTLLDALGIAKPEGLDGRSLMPLIENPSLVWDDGAMTFVYGSWSLRTDEFRYIRYADGSEELYDIAIDPHQWTNLAHESAYQPIKQAMLDQAVGRLAGHGWIQGTDGTAASLDGDGADNYLTTSSPGAVLRGGMGDDWYFIWSIGQTVEEAADGGIDTILVSDDFTMPLNVEVMKPYAIRAKQNFVLTGNEQDNTILGIAGKETMFGLDGDDVLRGGQGDDVLWGGNGDDQLSGQADADRLHGEAGDDTLTGDGSDVLLGGIGDDVYVIDDAPALVVENADEGADTVHSYLRDYTLAAHVENLKLLGDARTGRGNGLDNSLVGGEGYNLLTGAGGDDALDGGAGADRLQGGAGDDTYVVDDAGDRVTEGRGAGTDTVESSISYRLTNNVENLTLTGPAHIDGTGNGLRNTITGNAGNNRLDGMAGPDTMRGGAGNDTYVVDDAGDTATEDANAGTDLVESSVDIALGANVENLTLTGRAAIDGTGNSADNTIVGNGNRNLIDGRAGADHMAGGAGNDTYVVDNAGDVIAEVAGAGLDFVRASISYVLATDLENLTLTGSANIDAIGNSAKNVIVGNAGNNLIDGGAGLDDMHGGGGNDTYIVTSRNDEVFEQAGQGTDLVQSSVTHALSAHVENLTLTGTRDINATGNAGGNRLTGNAGSNRLDGGANADIMAGGAGNDTYVVDNAGDVVIERSGQGIDMVSSSIDYVLAVDVENLVLVDGGGSICGTGNNLDNVITGNAGANILAGLQGSDTLIGGIGADRLSGGGGDDMLDGGADADHIQGGIGNDSLWGGSGHDLLSGGSGNDTLDGGTGSDRMLGGAGNDMFYVDDAADLVVESGGQGTDTVYAAISYTLSSNFENLVLGLGHINGTGNAADNAIQGSAGDNVIDGKAGNDTLTGGLGADIFVIGTTLNGSANVDTITDFSVADDSFSLQRSIFTTLSAGTLGANTFVTGAGAADANDRIVYNSATGDLFFDADGSGAGAQVRFATIGAGLGLTNNDFIIVA